MEKGVCRFAALHFLDREGLLHRRIQQLVLRMVAKKKVLVKINLPLSPQRDVFHVAAGLVCGPVEAG